MLIKVFNAVAALALALVFTVNGSGQQPNSTQSNEPQYVENKGFKGHIFEIKHRRPQEIIKAISPLGSGFKGATVSYNDETQTISVRDFPENIAAIEEAIKRLDTPQSARVESSVELSIQVLLTRTDAPSDLVPTPPPPTLNDVIKQMQNTFAFKDYQLVATIVQRAKTHSRFQGGYAVYGKGDALWLEKYKRENGFLDSIQGKANYEYRVTGIEVSSNSSGDVKIQLDNFFFQFGNAVVQTDLEVRDSEKLVVGTASWGNKAMILVLTAKIIK
jgi:type II secretory pathway component GspD/PulD (secretin)